MKKYKTIILASISIYSQLCYSQDDWTIFPAENNIDSNLVEINNNDSIVKLLDFNNNKYGHISIAKSSKIDSLISNLDKENYIIGYTVQIEVSKQTKLIQDARIKFIKKFPKKPIFDEYIAPNTFLYGGVFYDKNDAYAFQNIISKFFSNTIVIKKEVELPSISGL